MISNIYTNGLIITSNRFHEKQQAKEFSEIYTNELIITSNMFYEKNLLKKPLKFKITRFIHDIHNEYESYKLFEEITLKKYTYKITKASLKSPKTYFLEKSFGDVAFKSTKII